MARGPLQIGVVSGAESGFVFSQEQAGGSQVHRRQRDARKVAAALEQVPGEVAQDVDQLQALAKSRALPQQPRIVVPRACQ